MYALDIWNGPNTEIASAERKAEQEKRWSEASWSYVYKTEVFPNLWLYIAAALLLPLLSYGLIRLLVMLTQWLYRGFTSS